MAVRIDISYKIPDARARALKQKFGCDVALADSYTIDADLTQREIENIVGTFINPLIEQNRLPTGGFDFFN